MQVDVGRASYTSSHQGEQLAQGCPLYRCTHACKVSYKGLFCQQNARSRMHFTRVLRLHVTSDGVISRGPTKVQAFLCCTLAKEAEGVVEALNCKKENVGVLLLNLGGPETLEDVQPFLYNLFADPASLLHTGYNSTATPSEISTATFGQVYFHDESTEKYGRICLNRWGLTLAQNN
ncbi:hypothetical protein L7F22_033199 [Adiantum nelumboides]|nr:hypothetical protein [Adiantum nelumboides]